MALRRRFSLAVAYGLEPHLTGFSEAKPAL
jgi:hypothetical protein